MSSFNSVVESRSLKRPRLGPPDVYPQDPKQKEDELTSVNVKQGFINQPAFASDNGEYGSAQHYSVDINKLNKSFKDILLQKQVTNTYSDAGKKRPPLTKDNFWLVPVAKNRNHVQQWIKELRGAKSLSSLGRRVPIFSKKEEVFQTLAENQITIVRGVWYIKMTAAYSILQAEAKNKKNRVSVDLNPEWTAAICKFMRDQLAHLLDDPGLGTTGSAIVQVIMQQSRDETERHFAYICKVAHHMFNEGMLDRHDFLTWIVETMEKIRLHGTHALSYMIPVVLKYIQDIVKNQLLSRRLAYVCCRLLNWILNENSWGSAYRSSGESPSGPHSVGPPSVHSQQRQQSAPPTPSQTKPLSPQKGDLHNAAHNTRKLYSFPVNIPDHLYDIAYFLIGFIQCITLECPGALVWYPPDELKSLGSPLDYLPAAPSILPLPSPKNQECVEEENALRSVLKEVECDIMERSYAAEIRWSSDKSQESTTGQTISRVLDTLEALDKLQNFDRTEPIEPLYNKIFSGLSIKDNAEQASNIGEEALVWLLCEWAISPMRLGEQRAAVVAKLLDKRQIQIESEWMTEISERTKAMNSSNAMNNSNPASVGSFLSSPPPQLMVEGVEVNMTDTGSATRSIPVPGPMETNSYLFQNLLFHFLDTQAPVLDDPLNKDELQSFKNLVFLFSELICHDVFSHDQYVSALITKGDVLPGQIDPLPVYNSSSVISNISIPSHGSQRNDNDVNLKVDRGDDLPSSVRSGNMKNDATDMPLFSPITDFFSPEGRPALDRHFTDVMRTELGDNSVDKMAGNGTGPGQISQKKPSGPIWGYKQPRHVQYLMHFPISFEDNGFIHESNQRLMVLYGVSRQRNEVKKAVKKLTKYVCKLVQKNSATARQLDTYSVQMPSVGSKKSRDFTAESPSSSPDVLLQHFRCLSYFDQHVITAQAAKTVISSFNDYSSGRSQNLPQMSCITLVLNLLEDALNIGGMVQLAVQIAALLVPLEAAIVVKHPSLAGCYTKDLALNVVAVLRHYQSYLTLDVNQTLQAFEAMHAFIKQSNIANPSHCTSPDRCVLIFLYDLYTSLPRSKHIIDMFSGSASAIKQTLCQSKIPATSNCRYDPQFLAEYIQQSSSLHPLVVARENSHRLREASSYKYSFVCSAIIALCSQQPNPERLSAIATLCAEMNAQCNDLSSEWLGVLKALCCSSCTANFNDVLLSVDPSDVMIRDPLALFTAILIARNCLSLEDFIQHVAIPSLLAACKPGIDVAEAETGARLTCHILLQLFKTPTHRPSAAPANNSGPDCHRFFIPEAADRHLLAASQRNIVVGAVLAVLKAIVKLGDANFGASSSTARLDKVKEVTDFLAPISGFDDCDEFAPKPSTSVGSCLDTASLSVFAKHAVRVICSQQWVRERCLKNIEWDFLMDQELTREQRQNLIQLICCPEKELQKLAENPQDQETYVASVLQRVSRWTLRQTLLELQIMLKQTAHDESLSDDIAKAVIEVFKNQQIGQIKEKSSITGLPLDNSNVWLMPPLVGKLSSQVQAKVLHEASGILDSSQHWSKSDHDRPNKSSASLLSQQPFLTLILTCLKGQDEQRDSLLDSLQSQILIFHSEWQNGRQQQLRDLSRESTICQSSVQEALQLRLSLMGGMFDTVENSSHWTSNIVVLLTQLINSGMVDIEVNRKLFHTVFDMIAALLHSTLGGDSPSSGEGRKRDYLPIVKKIKKEISDGKSASLDVLRRLLPVPKKETYVIACEPFLSGGEYQGLQIASKQKINPWDIIEGLKNTAPLCLSWFGAIRMERRELTYDVQQRLLIYHDHEFWQRPLLNYLKPPDLPDEEEEKPPTPKNIPEKKRKPSTSTRNKSPASYGTKDNMRPPSKNTRRKSLKKSQDLVSPYPTRTMNSSVQSLYGTLSSGGPIMSQNPHQVHSSGMTAYNNNPGGASYNMYHPSSGVMPGTYSNQSQHAKVPSAHAKYSLAQFLKTKSGQQQYTQNQQQPNLSHGGNIHLAHGVHSQPATENSKTALRTMIRRNTLAAGVASDMGGMPYRSRVPTNMGPPMSSSLRHMNPQGQHQNTGYSSYANTQQSGMGTLHPNIRPAGPSYNSYQGGGRTGQHNYHQVHPNQSFINQSQNTGPGYSINNMQMQGAAMNQGSVFNMQSGSGVQNQSAVMGGQQQPQYSMMSSQSRQLSRMNPQQQIRVGTGSNMVQMHGMVTGQNTMNDPMNRQRHILNQGMPMNSQYVQQQQTTQLVNSLRRNMPGNEGPLY